MFVKRDGRVRQSRAFKETGKKALQKGGRRRVQQRTSEIQDSGKKTRDHNRGHNQSRETFRAVTSRSNPSLNRVLLRTTGYVQPTQIQSRTRPQLPKIQTGLHSTGHTDRRTLKGPAPPMAPPRMPRPDAYRMWRCLISTRAWWIDLASPCLNTWWDANNKIAKGGACCCKLHYATHKRAIPKTTKRLTIRNIFSRGKYIYIY